MVTFHWLLTYAPLIALCVSILALIASFFSLGWNIYRDVVLKPRLKVSLGVNSLLVTDEQYRLSEHGPPFLELAATNHGPGEVVCSNAAVKLQSFPRSLFTKFPCRVIVPDWKHPLCSRLSCRVAVGDKISVIFPFEQECFLAQMPKRIGVSDSFGRMHWAPRRQLKSALRQYQKAFGAARVAAAEQDAGTVSDGTLEK